MTVVNGVLTQTSVSEVESFDHDQNGGCHRRFWFERAQQLKPDQTGAQSDGEKGHALFAEFFLTGRAPEGRVKMGKAVRGAIVKGELPKPGPDMIVESRLSGQPKYDSAGNWVPLDVNETLWLAGVPLDGFIDLAFNRNGLPEVWDHKFSSDVDAYAKPAAGLIKTVQMPVYVLSQIPYWPDAQHWRIVHHYIAKTGVHSFTRAAVVSVNQVFERKTQIETVIENMKVVAKATDQNDVPFNRKSCSAWLGCPHQTICSAFKENKVQLTPEEEALFAGLEGDVSVSAAAPDGNVNVPVADDPFSEPDDEVAALEAKLAAARAAKPKVRKLQVVDAPSPIPDSKAAGAVPLPGASVAPAKIPESYFCSKCLVALTPENASRLRDDTWKHIGCPRDVVAKPEVAPVLPPDAPASKPELASEQPKPPAEPKKRGPKPKPPTPDEITNVLGPRLTPPNVTPKSVDLSAPNVELAAEIGRSIRLVPRAVTVTLTVDLATFDKIRALL